MNYDSLITEVQDYANRTDAYFLSKIPSFITKAMENIYDRASHIGFETVLSSADFFTAGNPFVAKPLNWKKTISLQYTVPGATPSTSFLLNRSYEFCQTYWPNRASTGKPIFFAEYSISQFYFAPTPDAAYAAQLIYLGLPLFNEANQTNFLTQRYSNLLSSGTLIQAAVFLKDDERIPIFKEQFETALQNVNAGAVIS